MIGFDPGGIGEFAGYHVYSLVLLGIFLFFGFSAIKLPLVRTLFLPGSLAAGLLLLAFGPYVAGSYFPDLQLPAGYYKDWSALPGLLINVVFAALFLARPIMPLREMWRGAGPQVTFGQTLAWGQYAIGGLLTLFVLMPVFGMPPFTAALIEISFEGGHGTAAGLAPVFEELGFAEGRELAVGLATTSLLAALVSGTLLINWGRRKHHIQETHQQSATQLAYHRRLLRDLRREGIRVRNHVTPRTLASHLVLLALSIGIAWILHQGLIAAHDIFRYVPLFPLCMFGGMIGHSLWKWAGFKTSRQLVEIISAFALSVLITTAVGTVSLTQIIDNSAAFFLLAFVGIAWILGAFLFLAPRIFARHWFQRGIVDMGQSMGMTATGLLFLHMVDPHDRTNAMENFGYKQLLFEPFLGGGLVTAMSMPLILLLGLPAFTVLCLVVLAGWLWVGLRYFGRMSADRPERVAAASRKRALQAR